MKKVAIIGAGLSGLTAAWQLQQAGIAVVVVEAKATAGGRIKTVTGKRGTPMEMGATWFGPQHVYLQQCMQALQLQRFQQWQGGYALVEAQGVQELYTMPPQSEPYFRIAGGTGTLIKALVAAVGEQHIHYQTPIRQITHQPQGITLTSRQGTIYTADAVILALPPQLAAHQIQFTPALPSLLWQVMLQTQTWMNGSIKFAVEYATPFWKNEQPISSIFSDKGPAVEVYDHTDVTGQYVALKGFLSPAAQQLTDMQRKDAVIQQLVQYFGAPAANYLSYTDAIWWDEYIGCNAEQLRLSPHQNNGHPLYAQSYYQQQLWWAGAETAGHYGGYMDGAVEAGYRAANALLAGSLHAKMADKPV
jgi:monoamine oxidase